MFVVTEADAAAIRAVYEQRGEFGVELRPKTTASRGEASLRAAAGHITWGDRTISKASGI
jgi:hypothetical protein